MVGVYREYQPASQPASRLRREIDNLLRARRARLRTPGGHKESNEVAAMHVHASYADRKSIKSPVHPRHSPPAPRHGKQPPLSTLFYWSSTYHSLSFALLPCLMLFFFRSSLPTPLPLSLSLFIQLLLEWSSKLGDHPKGIYRYPALSSFSRNALCLRIFFPNQPRGSLESSSSPKCRPYETDVDVVSSQEDSLFSAF